MENAKVVQAIYRLGQVSSNPPACGGNLLRSLIDIAAEALGMDYVSAAVFERGVEGPATAVQVSGAWPAEACQRINDVTRWDIKERPLALKLAALDRNMVFRRSDLIEERAFKSSRLFIEVLTPMRLTGDCLVALFHRADGTELMLTFQRLDEKAAVPEDVVRKAQAVAAFIAQCWASSWRAEPGWMKALKPQSRRVLDDVLAGFDDDQIAERTGLTYHSVRAHLKRLFRDADVRSRLHLMQQFRSERGTAPIEALRVAGPVIATTGKSGAMLAHHTASPNTAARKPALSIAG
ncbi:MAG: hypothetical protein ACKVZJ_05075 [Phycisphaerales bacterium]